MNQNNAARVDFHLSHLLMVQFRSPEVAQSQYSPARKITNKIEYVYIYFDLIWPGKKDYYAALSAKCWNQILPDSYIPYFNESFRSLSFIFFHFMNE